MNVGPLVAALKAAVESGGTAGVPFGDGRKPSNATTRYIVAWFDAGRVEDSSLRSRDGWSAVGTFHCYGQTPDAARFANARLTSAVLGLVGVTVGSRVLLMPEQVTAVPLQRDDDADPAMFDVISEWRFRTSAL